MKKFLKAAVVFCLIAVMCLATACKTYVKPDNNDIKNEISKNVDFNADKNYSGTLKIAYQNIPTETAIIQSLINGFKQEYPNITVKEMPLVKSQYLESLPNKNAIARRTSNYSDMPDVMWTTNEILAGWVKKEMLMPVDVLDELDNNFSIADTFIETMVTDSSYDQNMYMFPRDYNQVVMYYNRALLAEAGIDESRIHSERALTATEFRQLLVDIRAAFKDKEGVNPNNNRPYNQVRPLDAQWAWGSLCWPVLKSFGGSVIDEKGNVNFNNQNNIDAVTYVRELIKDELTFGVGNTQSAQFTGQTAVMSLDVRAVLTDLIDTSVDGIPGVPAKDLGVAPMPMLSDEKNYSIGSGCSGYGMYRFAENQTAAWLFLKYLASEKGQNAFCLTGNGVPSNKNMLFDSNATWRNLNGGKFAELNNFNHDAFVYKWDTAACTLQDFKLRITVVGAREDVAKKVTQCVESALKSKVTTYVEDIKYEFKRTEQTIYNTIESNKK